MADERMFGGRTIERDGVVRFRLPADWTIRMEEHEGHAVTAFDAPGGGTLRLVTDRVTPPRAGEGGTAVLLREMALRFVRPDDPRCGDRVVEDRPGGGLIASAVLRTDEDGRTTWHGHAEAHYLWMLGAEQGGRVAAAMFSFALSTAQDGEEAAVAAIGTADAAIRAAAFPL
ncbi:hypothetical protein HL658_32765 [Azospirillum sp. RWY-5-1]|uniref:DUF1795 domain-containing protein n=1 Tax=Azospirillum oleiclasticum TaxID=2735135 RepID=A0ABX2TL11_9PROT|nr:hypothetical protein [Azospirillum oleiclasticum]NYZ17341.1 hypothetical protein [Azospirillum oleiclasticum]NYZ24717.1 hypothetical protein [Azospirillum oleiclasticum]